ncbi:uncharacterized protein BP5553_04695 [Venustampulla echinocandica]|uniref:Uncharacterized protein n=1 Tax=Venustampulla echinocandica TaxID=2656787 RepID=A0A370TP10_9HELO|nr:uncharacterized protein BP5553_04695 [Venustampulla echinocandica]RDL37262.1 hypothetical protein BP5553_04695 [Venustampulla echinocandica]
MGQENQVASADIPARPSPSDPCQSTMSQNNNAPTPDSKQHPHMGPSESSLLSEATLTGDSPINAVVEKRARRRHSDRGDSIYGVEDSNDADGSGETPRKKVRFDVKAEVVNPKKAWDKVTIGSHIDDPRIPVIAEKSDNGTICMTVVRDRTLPLDILRGWRRFSSENGSVPLNKIKLDPNIFKGYADAEPSDPEKKYELIKTFLDPPEGAHEPDMETEVDETPTETARPNTKEPEVAKTGPEATELQVGVCRMDNRIPVYAYLRQENQIWFRVHEEESEMSQVLFSGTAIRYEQVELDSKFIKSNERTTRAYIRSLLKETVNGEAETEETATRYPERSRRRRPGSTTILGEEAADNTIGDEPLTDIQARVNEVINKVVNDQENSARELNKVLGDYGRHSAQQADTIKEQQVTIERQTRTIELLRLRLADLESAPNQQPENENEQTNEAAANPFAPPPVESLKGFCVIPDGKENAGMLVEKHAHHARYNRAYYNERLLLQELKIVIRGEDSGETINIDGMASRCYVEADGSKKLIERPQGSRSFLELEGRHFIKWVKREQITLEEYWKV